MITEIYNKGEVIGNEGEAANSFFIIKQVKFNEIFLTLGGNFFMSKVVEIITKFKIRRFFWRTIIELCSNKIVYSKS